MNLRDFNAEGHWYTSYPSLNHWTEDFGHKEYAEALKNHDGALSLYVHIPFCKKLCHYCICNVVISNDRAKIQFFLDHLLKEADNLKAFAGELNIKEIHLGGGTPSHLDRDQFTQLCDKLNTLSDLKGLDEFAMEIDPRTVTVDDLRHYASHGVNRISFGVQDFDLKVQEAINRVQPPEMIENLLKVRHLFKGVNFDLLYGLPHQTMKTFGDTLDRTIQMRPERVTLLKYCHAPEVRKHMKLINITDLPAKQDLQPMFEMAIDKLCKAGYVWVGMDHFALPSDSLAMAHNNGTVERTFNGFKAGPTKYMIGLGPTSTSYLYKHYAQAHYDLNKYYDAVNRGEFPILRGVELTQSDMSCRWHIFDLLCNQETTITRGGWAEQKKQLLDSGMVESINSYPVSVLKVKPQERIYLRNICKLFDIRDIEPEHMKIAQKTITRKMA